MVYLYDYEFVSYQQGNFEESNFEEFRPACVSHGSLAIIALTHVSFRWTPP
jgi:hypothetical protein